MSHLNLEKVLEKLAVTDKATIVVAKEADGCIGLGPRPNNKKDKDKNNKRRRRKN